MGSIIYNKNKIMEFNDNDRQCLITYFSLMETKYTLYNENIIIFPTLFDKTLILKAITKNEEEKALVKYIKNELINEGATVLFDENFADKAYFEYVDPQILIVLSFGEKQTDLTVYLPFNPKKISTLVTKQLLKRLISLETNITYKIADRWNKLKKTKYWTYLLGNSIPILVVEISNSALSENFLGSFGDILVKSIVEELGNKPSNEEVEEVISKLKSYKSKLDEELQSVNNNIEDIYIEKLENRKIEDTKEKKNIKAQSKKIHLSKISSRNINKIDLNQPLPYPLMYPGEGPVYKFQRPILNTESAKLQQSYIEAEKKLQRVKKDTKAEETNNKKLRVKIHLPKISSKDIDKVDLNQQLAYPIMYSVKEPVYQYGTSKDTWKLRSQCEKYLLEECPSSNGIECVCATINTNKDEDLNYKDNWRKDRLYPYWNNYYYRQLWYYYYPVIYPIIISR